MRDGFPTILWRLDWPDRTTVRATLVQSDSKVRLLWYIDDHVQGVEEFSTVPDAMRRAEELRLLVAFRSRR
jgi:hypothetical protein